MASDALSSAEALAGLSFEADGRTINVERLARRWRLHSNGRVLDTRDLAGGVDELLGRAPGNLALVLRILEWDADASR